MATFLPQKHLGSAYRRPAETSRDISSFVAFCRAPFVSMSVLQLLRQSEACRTCGWSPGPTKASDKKRCALLGMRQAKAGCHFFLQGFNYMLTCHLTEATVARLQMLPSKRSISLVGLAGTPAAQGLDGAGQRQHLWCHALGAHVCQPQLKHPLSVTRTSWQPHLTILTHSFSPATNWTPQWRAQRPAPVTAAAQGSQEGIPGDAAGLQATPGRGHALYGQSCPGELAS